MTYKNIISTFMLLFIGYCAFAQSVYIDPVATYSTEDGTEESIHSGESYSGSAPLNVKFQANPSNDEG